MKQKIAFFDFCETLINFQTADRFIHFIREKENNFLMNLKEFLRKILIKTRFLYLLENFGIEYLNKKMVLWQIKGFDSQKIKKYSKQFHEEKIKPGIIKKVFSEMKKLKKKDYAIYIVSAGYDIHIKDFVDEFELDGLICTKVLFKKNICQGKFDGLNCVGRNKIKLILDFFQGTDFDKEKAIAYGDSIKDIPLLKWVGKGIIVSKDKPNNWAKKYGLRELIWKK